MVNLKLSREFIQAAAPAVRNLVDAFHGSMPALREVVKKWEGKVINKRFPEALEACMPTAQDYSGWQYKRIRIDLKREDCGKPGEKWRNISLYTQESFGTNYAHDLRDIIPLGSYFTGGSGHLQGMGERLNAEQFLAALEDLDRKMELCARDYEDMAANYASYEAQLNEVQQYLDEHLASIPWHLQPSQVSPDFSKYRMKREEREQKLMEGAA